MTTPEPQLIATLTDFKTVHSQVDSTKVWQSFYFDGHTPALVIADSPESPIECVASVSLVGQGIFPAPGHVFIKDWEENEGVRVALEAAGVIGPAVREIPSGFVTVTEHKILAAGE